jgi:hypothetical protein
MTSQEPNVNSNTNRAPHSRLIAASNVIVWGAVGILLYLAHAADVMIGLLGVPEETVRKGAVAERERLAAAIVARDASGADDSTGVVATATAQTIDQDACEDPAQFGSIEIPLLSARI